MEKDKFNREKIVFETIKSKHLEDVSRFEDKKRMIENMEIV